MSTQYTPLLKVALPTPGELTGTWGDVVNNSITLMFEQAIAGLVTVNIWAANSHTLSVANGVPSESRAAIIHAVPDGAGAPNAAATIICPALSKLYAVRNTTGYPLTFRTAAGTGVVVADGDTQFLMCDGVEVYPAVDTVATLTVPRLINGTAFDGSQNITTDSWGTSRTVTIGSTARAVNGSAAVSWTLADIGATTVGGSMFTLTNPSAITFPRFNADNTVSALSAADFRTAIGAGTSSTTGTVTSVGVSVPTGLAVTNSPITTSGTIAISLAAGYSIPTTAKQTDWDTAFTDRNKWDGGSSGLTASTGRTSLGATTVGANLFTLGNPDAITFLRVNANNTVTALDAASFRTAIGVGEGSGTVTSVGVSVPTGLAVTNSPITTSGTIAISLAAGYSIPTTAKQTDWDTAFTDRNKWDGGDTGLVASTGRTSLGATTVGASMFTLTNPGEITFPRFNANNTVTALNAADFRTAIGAGTSSTTGTVTSVGMTVPSFLSVSPASITTSGTFTVSLSGTALPVLNGGTGGTTQSAARTGLGATTVGANLFTLTNPSAITFPRFNADNTVSALSAADFRTAIGAGTGNVTLTGTETLSNKTLTKPTINEGYAEQITALGTTTLTNLTLVSRGSIQTITLSANSSPTDSLLDGQSLTLMVDDGTARTITWPSVTWKTNGGVAPTLNTTGFTVIQLWKVSSVLYGARVGDA